MKKAKVMNILLTAAVIYLAIADVTRTPAAVSKVTANWEMKGIKIYRKLKLGENIVTVKQSSQGSHFNFEDRRVDFIATKEGTYQVTVSDIASDTAVFPASYVQLFKKKKPVLSDDLKHKKQAAHLLSTDWFKSVYDVGNFTEIDKKVVEGNGVDTVTYTVRMKTGDKLKLRFNNLGDMWDTLYHWSECPGSVSAKVSVTKIK